MTFNFENKVTMSIQCLLNLWKRLNNNIGFYYFTFTFRKFDTEQQQIPVILLLTKSTTFDCMSIL